jgi:predicted nucleic acid-binding protein
LIQALIEPQGTVGAVLRRFHKADHQPLHADPLLAGFVDVLARPPLRAKSAFSTKDLAAVLSPILLRGESVARARRFDVCRDVVDNMLAEAEDVGPADAIVTGEAIWSR